MKDYFFGNLVASLRTAKGYSQFQLGKLLSVSDKAVSKWENGDAKPRLATCSKLAEILGVSVNELLSAANSTKNDATQEVCMVPIQQVTRLDQSVKKRVELHLRTGMSGEDSFGDIVEYVNTATAWGHEAIAVTDLHITNSFPLFSKNAKKEGIKPIYGCELWMTSETGSDCSDGLPVMVLVRNREGMVNLNRIISESHTVYLKNGIPCTPRHLLSRFRQGLLVGAACNGGEVIKAVNNGTEGCMLERMVSFYDYLEVQPPECVNTYFENDSLVRETVQKIVSLGQDRSIPVVAVGNVHYVTPEESILYNALRYSNGETEFSKNTPLYFRTTEEMLQAFNFLDTETANRIVIENTLLISGLIDDGINLYPQLPEGKMNFYPIRHNAENELSQVVYDRAHALYGDILPNEVNERLEQELRIIDEKKYGTLYADISSIVRHSDNAGYPVTNRGTAASSFVSMLCGITNCNPLPPHYYCNLCKISDFNVDTDKYRMGTDLPERNCPECGAPMIRDGFNLPFDSFLGRNGEKVPDFDMNFAPEYQKEAQKYVADMYGQNHGLIAGTVAYSTEQSIEDILHRYADDHDISISDEVINRLRCKAQSIRRLSACYPGGVVIIPPEYDAEEFTPVQYPAGDYNSQFMSTHYEYNSMHKGLLKIDMLSNNTPELLHRLKLMNDFDFDNIPLNDRDVLSLFYSQKPLGVDEEVILSRLGTYGIPEFSSDKVRQLLKQLKPETFSDLVAIIGISHGAGIWENNAELLIKSGVATLADIPAHREDILDKLLAHGIERDTAYKAMESVRKGRGLPSEIVSKMLDAGIPSWYISMCQKILYLFPKAHTVSYVSTSVRLAWIKLYYPNNFYTVWMRKLIEDTEDGDMMMDMKQLRRTILSLRNEEHTLFSDNDREHALELLLEMRARGVNPFLDIPRDLIPNGDKDSNVERLSQIVKFLGNQNSPFIRNIRLVSKEEQIECVQRVTNVLGINLPTDSVLSLLLNQTGEENSTKNPCC